MDIDQIYTRNQRLAFYGLGLLVAASLIWTTYLYFSYRHINVAWEQNFTTPEEFWDISKGPWKGIDNG
jgi:hypothetical protein